LLKIKEKVTLKLKRLKKMERGTELHPNTLMQYLENVQSITISSCFLCLIHDVKKETDRVNEKTSGCNTQLL
jgi:hypothetical protein